MSKFGQNPHIVIVSGPPTSGKTTIARPLAEALGFALLTKDDVKEALFTAMHGPEGDLEFSRRIGDAAIEVLWTLAPHCPGVVLEANFHTRRASGREKVMALPGKVIEIHCTLPLEEASRRFAQRARDERHHPAHALHEISIEQLAEYAEPFGLSPVVEVDTRSPVNIRELARRIEAIWAGKRE